MRCCRCGELLADPAYVLTGKDRQGEEHTWFVHEECALDLEELFMVLEVPYELEMLTREGNRTVLRKME